MKTVSVSVMNLCVPCHCHCRYCLLSWSGRTTGVDYARSESYARRFHTWVAAERPDLNFSFFFGYSMEHPQLLRSIDFLHSIGSPGGEFLQLNGLRMRSKAETEAFLHSVKDHGVHTIDLTFYGMREYHDRFAGRSGDFDYLMTLLACANRIGLNVQAGLPLTQENAAQANDLIAQLQPYALERLFLFVPHAEGRGATLDPIRLRTDDLALLNDETRSHFKRSVYKTAAEWAESDVPDWEHRAVTIALTPDTADALERMPFADAIAQVEALDDAYHAALPSFSELLNLYADASDTALYSRRDLSMHLQKRYIGEHKLSLYDIHDERQSFVRRF